MEKLNYTFKREYKGTEIEIIVEEDLITTTKVYANKELVSYCEVSTESNKEGIPFNRENFKAVLDSVKSDVDEIVGEEVEVTENA